MIHGGQIRHRVWLTFLWVTASNASGLTKTLKEDEYCMCKRACIDEEEKYIAQKKNNAKGVTNIKSSVFYQNGKAQSCLF